MSEYSTSDEDFKLDSYEYNLPPEFIAQSPINPRDAAKLLVVSRTGEIVEDSTVKNLADFIPADSVIVLNEVKVIPARFYARKSTGAKVEILILRFLAENQAEALLQSRRPIKMNDEITFEVDGEEKKLKVLTTPQTGGIRVIQGINCELNANLLEKIGLPPLPPYIKREAEDARYSADKTRYQTVFAGAGNAAAAPTAGLHFTPELLVNLEKKCKIFKIVLNVGLGTFQPVKVKDIRDHSMHSESYEISPETVKELQQAKANGQKIISIGTTTVRTLETVATANFTEDALKNSSEIFIYPGYEFKIVDSIMTNFHLPGSTLIMMIAAFLSRKKILNIYDHAISHNYRFFSYGDAMLIQP